MENVIEMLEIPSLSLPHPQLNKVEFLKFILKTRIINIGWKQIYLMI